MDVSNLLPEEIEKYKQYCITSFKPYAQTKTFFWLALVCLLISSFLFWNYFRIKNKQQESIKKEMNDVNTGGIDYLTKKD